MRRFHLYRAEDETGISGTGIVADGVEFNDGAAILHWRGETASTTVFGSLSDVLKVHGHGGKTTVEWLDVPPAGLYELKR